ncbi:hypothetical protein [Oxalobacter formigenes]|uniref:Uncharacterized protein n=1 Tax=Oxalobacter formigenes OXCC13 TaxID=556269 RepID=C3X8B5_OXAFO|nr:hypothetical protein [Oxalobacter formigenes]ARQ46519.1 hypothetical protein BRW83_1778 [Oxalobacter formigenes]ARQ78614.1 hypothetical protein BRW84_08330 [Oxalobacter formigenes OXCC13]EEO29441.1 hypothetical protein OFBG_00469 [Oxalobacter formigenes OXCC13]MCZ4061731.1 hypothetical protein [Oxalobacter formigenes]QDX32810.1 hypothetical protein FPZ51_04020 [Oxalobacter formigenes]
MDIVAIYENIYQNNIALRTLLQLIPGGSSVDTALSGTLSLIKEKRRKEFFDELANGNIELTEDIIKNEDFLHCFFITHQAALRTRKTEKIRFLARLLKRSLENETFSNIDDYEEMLNILDELSYREISILLLLDAYEAKYPHAPGENDLQRAYHFWTNFENDASKNFQITELDTFMIRLSRSGCYELFTGIYHEDTRGKGKTTPFFQRIKEIVTLDENS